MTIDVRQSANYKKYLETLGWKVERINNINYFVRTIPLLGNILKLQRPETVNFSDIEKLNRKYKFYKTIVEPKNNLQSDMLLENGYKLSKEIYLPSKTLELDLGKSIKSIFTSLKKDTRYSINKIRKINLNVLDNSDFDLETFRNCWKKSVGMKRYVPPLTNLKSLEKYFKKNVSFLLFTDYKKRVFSGAIFIISSSKAYYWQAFTNNNARKILLQYKIVWEGILWSKKMGAKIFDFEGIYDSRFPNKSWLGFTHFKKSFGGKEIEYPGCYIKNKYKIFL